MSLDQFHGDSTAAFEGAAPDAATLDRVAKRWAQFERGLSDTDVMLLNTQAAGTCLKQACHSLDLKYDTVQKRFKRWQALLGLQSMATLIHVWCTVKGREIDRESHPTVLRYAEHLRSKRGFTSLAPLPAIAISPMDRASLLGASVSNGANARKQHALANSIALLCPVAWWSLIDATMHGTHALQRQCGMNTLHAVFRTAIGYRFLTPSLADVAAEFDALVQPRSNPEQRPRCSMMADAMFTLINSLNALQPLRNASTARASAVMSSRARYFDSPLVPIADDKAFFQTWLRSGMLRHEFDERLVFAPLAGATLLLHVIASPDDALRSQHVARLNQIVASRSDFATSVRLHPSRLLAQAALSERGASVVGDMSALGQGETLATASVEQLLLALMEDQVVV